MGKESDFLISVVSCLWYNIYIYVHVDIKEKRRGTAFIRIYYLHCPRIVERVCARIGIEFYYQLPFLFFYHTTLESLSIGFLILARVQSSLSFDNRHKTRRPPPSRPCGHVCRKLNYRLLQHDLITPQWLNVSVVW